MELVNASQFLAAVTRNYFMTTKSLARTDISDTQRRIYKAQSLSFVSRDSAVGIATGYTIEGSEFESRESLEFSLLHVAQTGSGVHSTSYTMGTGCSFPGCKVARD
jgi:hypothetical protein